MGSVKDVLGKWGKKAADATKKAEDLAGNMWQHREYYFECYGLNASCSTFRAHFVLKFC